MRLCFRLAYQRRQIGPHFARRLRCSKGYALGNKAQDARAQLYREGIEEQEAFCNSWPELPLRIIQLQQLYLTPQVLRRSTAEFVLVRAHVLSACAWHFELTSWPWYGSESKEIITKPSLNRCAVIRRTKVKKTKKTESNLRLEGQQSPACTTARAAGCDGSAYEERLDGIN